MNKGYRFVAMSGLEVVAAPIDAGGKEHLARHPIARLLERDAAADVATKAVPVAGSCASENGEGDL